MHLLRIFWFDKKKRMVMDNINTINEKCITMGIEAIKSTQSIDRFRPHSNCMWFMSSKNVSSSTLLLISIILIWCLLRYLVSFYSEIHIKKNWMLLWHGSIFCLFFSVSHWAYSKYKRTSNTCSQLLTNAHRITAEE